MYGENLFDRLEHWCKKRVGFDDPVALEWGGWDNYNARYKATHPIIYFVFHTVIGGIQKTFWIIARPWGNFWSVVRNRFVTKAATVNIQSLSRNCYHDLMEVLLHANFQVLVDFVEWEVGIFNRPKWYQFWRKIPIIGYFAPPIRSREEGLKHLEWECGLTYDANWVGEGDPRIGQPSDQALCAREKRDLYLWWKDVRPNRPGAMDASGLSAYYDAKPIKEWWNSGSTVIDRSEWKPLSDECQRIEKTYDDEDEEMLHKLIRIHRSLWT